MNMGTTVTGWNWAVVTNTGTGLSKAYVGVLWYSMHPCHHRHRRARAAERCARRMARSLAR